MGSLSTNEMGWDLVFRIEKWLDFFT